MRSLLVALLIAFPILAADPSKPSALVGSWVGLLNVEGKKLKLVIHVKDVKGKLTATLDSPDQGAKGIPMPEVEFKDAKARLHSPALEATFEGKLSEDGKTLTGEWKQGGAAFPLEFKPYTPEPIKRPQTPKAPFPYKTEDVTFENTEAKITLAGTLTLPQGQGPFPAVVLVSGSGPQDRDETLFDHKPFLVIADHLTRQGIAVLRYDDRGVAKSGGKFSGATTADFATDAYAAVKYLQSRKEIDAKRLGIAGHSEGGIVAPLAASQHPADVKFVILLAGTAVTGREILDRQRLDILKASGATEASLKRYKEMYDVINPIVGMKGTVAERTAKIQTAVKEFAKDFTEDMRKSMGIESEAAIGVLAAVMLDPWMVQFFRYDPSPALKLVECPVLALNGSLDLQVSADENLPRIEASLKAGKNPPAKIITRPGLNHLFQPTKTGAITEYGTIETTFDPETLTILSDWLLALSTSQP
jgi:uncharacterized protein